MGPNNLVVRAYWFKETVVCVCVTPQKSLRKLQSTITSLRGYSQQLGRPGVSWLNAVYPIYMNSIESIRDARFKFEPVKLMS